MGTHLRTVVAPGCSVGTGAGTTVWPVGPDVAR